MGYLKYLLVFFAGALNPLGFAPFEWWPLLVLSFGVLFWAWLPAGPAQGFRIGLLFGLGQFGFGTSWVYVSIQTFGGMPPILAAVCVMALTLILSLFPALAGWAQGLFNRHSVYSKCIVIVPVFYVVFEWLRGWIFSGFPWLTTGYATLDTPLAGLAPLVGVYGASLAFLISMGVVIALFSWPDRKTVITAIFVVGVWGIAWMFDHKPWTVTQGDPIETIIVQNNISLLDKWNINRREEIIDEYLEVSEGYPNRDLIVWPEGAVPGYFGELPGEFWNRLQQHPAGFCLGRLASAGRHRGLLQLSGGGR